MESLAFDGQQAGERVLYTVTPHPLSRKLSIAKVIFFAVLVTAVLMLLSTVLPSARGIMQLLGVGMGIIILLIGLWWTNRAYASTKTFITDRRIIRIESVTPLLSTKRALFWNEALKAKAYAPNFLFRIFGIGTLAVEPQLSEHENVIVRDVSYYEDLANYIDKILFTFKNKPEDIAGINSFIPKPRGHRTPET
jgi:hypothetical protein